jgi:hypothetical protein
VIIMAAWIAPAIAALGSIFGGKSERSAANDARRQQEALVRQMLADAEAAFGPEAAPAAVQKGLEDVARQQAAAQMGMEHNLYARGMGERTPGTRAQAEEAGLLGRLQTRQNIEMEYPMKLQQARSMALGGATQVAQQAEERAGAASALPFDLLGLYQASTGQSAWEKYLKGQTSGYQVPSSNVDFSAITRGTGLTPIKPLPLPTYKF